MKPEPVTPYLPKGRISTYRLIIFLFFILFFPARQAYPMQSYYFYPAVNLTNNNLSDCWISMTMDSQGYMHIAWNQWNYHSETVGEICYLNNVGGSWNPMTRVYDDTIENYAPDIAVGQDGYAHIVWYDLSDGERDVYYVNNRSGSWSEPTNISNACPGNNYNPTIVADSSGYAHVAWHDSFGDDEIYYAHDGPGGWTSPQNITNSAGGVNEGGPNLCIDENDNLYLAYLLNKTGTLNEAVYFMVQTGGSWGTPERVTDWEQDDGPPDIKIDSNKKSHLAFYESTDPLDEVFYTNNIDGWQSPYRLTYNSFYDSRPRICVSQGDDVHIAWDGGEIGSSEMYYVNNIGGWGDPVQLNLDSDDNQDPNIAIDSNNNIHLIFRGYDVLGGSDSEIYYVKGEPIPTGTPTPSPITPTPTPTVTPTVTPTLTPSPTPDGYKTPTPTPSVTPTLSVTPTPTPTASPSPTATPPPLPVPYTENFDGPWSGGAPGNYPNIWSKQFISGTTDWVQYSGCLYGVPPAHDGYNALFAREDLSGPETRLISPPLEFGMLTLDPKLSFWHAQSDWGGDQDELTVYYRVSDGGAWVELTHYPDNVPDWTLHTLDLPSPGDRYFICFKGYADYGWGIGIDDVLVTGEAAPTPTPSPSPVTPMATATPTATPSVAPTVTPTPTIPASPTPTLYPTASPSSTPILPTLEPAYSTYLGGENDDQGNAITVDSSGSTYITGYTQSVNFPSVNAYQANFNGDTDVFASRLSSNGSHLVYSTYLGLSDEVYPNGIFISDNCTYIIGYTTSDDFPTVNAYQASRKGGSDAFVSKIGSTGSSLLYSTYLGGNGYDYAYGVAVIDSEAYVAGHTASSNFPTANAYQVSRNGNEDAFISKLNSSGSALIYSTYLGGSGYGYARGISVEQGAAYVTGYTASNDFPTLNAYQPSGSGSYDAYVSKLSSSGSSLLYSTYLGGSNFDEAYGISAVNGEAYITGYTQSDDLPTVNAYQTSKGSIGPGFGDAFVSKLSTSGSSLSYSTYLGGTNSDYGQGISVGSGVAYVAGYTTSSNFPILNAYQASRGGSYDAFIIKFGMSGSYLSYSTYLGGSGSDQAFGVSVIDDVAYVTGKTASSDFPTVNAYQTSIAGLDDVFVTKLTFTIPQPSATTTPTPGIAPTPTISLTPTPASFTPTPTNSATPTPAIPPSDTPTPSPPIPTPQSLIPIVDSGDYDGDGTSDIAIFRDSSGLWSVRGVTRVYYGSASDLPVSGDYDGNGTADVGIFRAGSGLWGVRGVTRVYYGSTSDIPIPGDYNGDGSCDTGIFRTSSGLWAVRNVSRAYFGGSGDRPVPGDYDGDGRKDIAVFRPGSGMWAIQNLPRIYFGSSGDTVVPGDYDGDGTWEAGIFRATSGLWAIRGVTRAYYGVSSDRPVPADFEGDGADEIAIFRPSSGLWAIRGVTRAYFGSSGDLPVTR